MLVLPRPRVREFLAHQGNTGIVVTDCGYFPRAQSHGRDRRHPIGQVVILVCVDGAGWCETSAGRFRVESGDAVIFPPGQPHAYESDPEQPWTLWWLHLAGQSLQGFLEATGVTLDSPVRKPSNLYRLVSLITEVLRWMERDQTMTSLLAASGAAWHVLTSLATDVAGPGGTLSVIDESAAYLRENLGHRVSVEDLATVARLSTSHFATLFKQRIGFPVLHYQTQLRMARARELLDTSDRSISSVASEVGYPDSFYFARQFKRIHGVTPRQYRAQHNG
jgi:AraC family transcriptional regulator, arabinose operon regulatory protein